MFALRGFLGVAENIAMSEPRTPTIIKKTGNELKMEKPTRARTRARVRARVCHPARNHLRGLRFLFCFAAMYFFCFFWKQHTDILNFNDNTQKTWENGDSVSVNSYLVRGRRKNMENTRWWILRTQFRTVRSFDPLYCISSPQTKPLSIFLKSLMRWVPPNHQTSFKTI